MAQKIGIVVMMPSEAMVRNTRPRTILSAGKCTMATKPKAPMKAGIAQCQRRSSFRSEWRPIRTIPTAVMP